MTVKHPTNLVFVDTETSPRAEFQITSERYGKNPVLNRMNYGTACGVRLANTKPHAEQWVEFTDPPYFWSWLISRLRSKTTTWVFAHNMGFDAAVLGLRKVIDDDTLHFPIDIRETSRGRVYRPPLLITDSPPTCIELADNAGRKMYLVDTLNYWRVSLADLGDSLGFPKLPAPDFGVVNAALRRYCRQDVEIIKQAVLRLIRWTVTEEFGGFGFTGPSIAKQAFDHRFATHRITQHAVPEIKALERRGYYGGQCELFKQGVTKCNTHQLDVTSLYPSVMRGNNFPVGLDDYEVITDPRGIDPFDLGNVGCADVLLDQSERVYPKRLDRRIVYTQGRHWTTLCGPELQHAYRSGHCLKFGTWACYRTAPIFNRYVDYFWAMRLAAIEAKDKVQIYFAKLLLNSLYGKFGQKLPRWEYVENAIPEEEWSVWYDFDHDTQEQTRFRALGPLLQREVERAEHPKSFPIIAAFVTAYARERMNHFKEICGYGNLFYQAVDAVFVNNRGLRRLQDAGEVGEKVLGMLNLEISSPWAFFRGIHNYRIGDKRIVGAVKPQAEQLPDGRYRENRFQSFSDYLVGPFTEGVIIGEATKDVPGSYDRGTIALDGTVTPHKLCEPIPYVATSINP